MRNDPLVLMILGTHRTGTSCLAGVLSHLGVPMGKSGLRPNAGNPKGFYEDRLLRKLSKQCGGEFPRQPFVLTFPQRVALLRQWRDRRKQDSPIIGGKLPALGMMVPELAEAFGGRWKALITERPVDDSARSRYKWRWRLQSLPDIANDLRALADMRDASLEGLEVPTLRIPFLELIQTPAQVIDKLAAFCGLTPTQEQHQAAVAFVDPRLNHETRR